MLRPRVWSVLVSVSSECEKNVSLYSRCAASQSLHRLSRAVCGSRPLPSRAVPSRRRPLSSQSSRDGPCGPCTGRPILNPWTGRDVPEKACLALEDAVCRCPLCAVHGGAEFTRVLPGLCLQGLLADRAVEVSDHHSGSSVSFLFLP